MSPDQPNKLLGGEREGLERSGVGLATWDIFFPLHIALDMPCHPRGWDEGLAIEERKREKILGALGFFIPLISFREGWS